ncbi:hypothetical protein [Edaphobacter flagellatus]|uniref:hypothetical protein n=1 Tax=Edaphobacter flagellatus TaxID=1933044 RepID=UPI0021B45A42|nr:hypothetical protein [Edaphobacter flagellatus]
MRTWKRMGFEAGWLSVAITVLSPGIDAQQLKSRGMPQTQAEMHQRVQALYDFHPLQLSDGERSKKSAEMDYFWTEMKGDTSKSLPLLRVELREAPQGSFFLTDGSELLLSLSTIPEDKQLAADALARTNLRDTESGTYFFTVHDLACAGVDVTAAALHILDDSRFLVSVPQHAMTLDQNSALMYVLLSMKDDRWVKAAAERFAQENNVNAKRALVAAFDYAQTDEADAELKRIAADASQPDAVRKDAREFVEEAGKSVKGGLQVKGTVAEIREQRRKRLRSVSDEAIFDVQWMTKRMAQMRAKGMN